VISARTWDSHRDIKTGKHSVDAKEPHLTEWPGRDGESESRVRKRGRFGPPAMAPGKQWEENNAAVAARQESDDVAQCFIS